MRAIVVALPCLSVLVGCLPSGNTVTMSGMVYDVPNAAGSVVGSAEVRTIDADGVQVDAVTTDDGGEFSALVPEGDPFFVQVDGPAGLGYVPTAFSGNAGLNDFDAGTGFPWVSSAEWFAELQADWEGCPGADSAGVAGAGVVVVGEVRMWLNVGDIDDMPVQQGSTVIVSPETGAEVSGCYHDDEGLYDEGASGTGADGLFAVFGVAPGVSGEGLAVLIEYDDTSGVRRPVIYQYRAEDGGLVPIYPTFVYDE